MSQCAKLLSRVWRLFFLLSASLQQWFYLKLHLHRQEIYVLAMRYAINNYQNKEFILALPILSQ